MPNAIMFDFLECASFRHGKPGGRFWDIIRRPCVNEVSQLDSTLRRGNYPSQKFCPAEAWSPDNEHRHAFHPARQVNGRGVAVVSPVDRSGWRKLTLKQCVVRCKNALSGRAAPHACAEARKRHVGTPSLSRTSQSASQSPCMKIRLRRGEDRNKNEPMFDFTSKPAAAAFNRVSGRVAARTISFWSRPVAVSE